MKMPENLLKITLKVLTVILVLFAIGQSHQTADVLEDVGKDIIKRGTHKAIQSLASYCAFLEIPSIILALFEITSGVDLLSNMRNLQSSLGYNITPTLNDINFKVDELSKNMLRFEKEMMEKLETHEQHEDLKAKLEDFYSQVFPIDFLYKEYLTIVNESTTYSNETIVTFFAKIKSYDTNGVRFPLARLHELLLTTRTTGTNIPMYYANFDSLVSFCTLLSYGSTL